MLVVTLPFGYEPDYVSARKVKNASMDMLTENQAIVLRYLSDNPIATLQETALACGLSLGGVKKWTF